MKEFTPFEFLSFTVQDEEEGQKVRVFLENRGLSSRYIRRSVRQEDIYLNGNLLKENAKLCAGDEIHLRLGEEELNVKPQEGPLEIIWEDDDLLILNKPPHMVTHTAKDDVDHTLINYVAGYFLQQGIRRKVRFVNRLDRDTSGLILVAKNSFSHSFLAKQLENRSFEKKYWAICEGFFDPREGEIVAPIGLGEDGIRRQVCEGGKYARTGYRVLEEKILEQEKFSLVEVKLYTGRTHQIRVHMAHLNHPILGDGLYGRVSPWMDRQALHSCFLTVTHPRWGNELTLTTPLPADFCKIFKR